MYCRQTTRECLKAVLNFGSVDRLPVIEWAPYWNLTIERWESEGMPAGMNKLEIQRYFGLDALVNFKLHPFNADMPRPAYEGAARISSDAEYRALLEQNILLSENLFDETVLKRWNNVVRQRDESDDIAIKLDFQGFFWFQLLLPPLPYSLAFYQTLPSKSFSDIFL